MVLKIQNQRHLGPYGGITGRRRRRSKGTLLSSSRIASLFVSPYRFPLSSHRTVFPSRLPVNFLYGAKWLWFYGFKEPTPTTLGPVLGHYGQTEKEVQNQRRLGPYGGITGRRRGRFKTNDAWARTGALRADGEGHYGQTTRGIDILIFLSCIPHTLLYLRNLFSWVIIVGTAKIPKIENRRVLGSAVLRFF